LINILHLEDSGVWDVMLCCWVSGSQCFEGTSFFQNIRNHSSSDILSHPGRLASSVTSL